MVARFWYNRRLSKNPLQISFTGERIIFRLRHKLFQSITNQEIAFFDKRGTGELVNRLSGDTSLVGHAITYNVSDGLRALVQASVGVSMMVMNNEYVFKKSTDGYN